MSASLAACTLGISALELIVSYRHVRQNKKVPEFQSEEEERRFWAENDSTDFIDWSSGVRGKFPNLRPTLLTVSEGLDKERRRSPS
jgi:hypothetical protein